MIAADGAAPGAEAGDDAGGHPGAGGGTTGPAPGTDGVAANGAADAGDARDGVAPPLRLGDLAGRVGEPLGTSEWILVDQARIDAFAAVTGDRQFIHVDPAAAALTPWGGTVAHGLLTLSLLPVMQAAALGTVQGARMMVNGGFDSVRFLSPVRSGRRVRGRFSLAAADERAPGQWRIMFDVVVEIEGEDRPALVARWIGILFG